MVKMEWERLESWFMSVAPVVRCLLPACCGYFNVAWLHCRLAYREELQAFVHRFYDTLREVPHVDALVRVLLELQAGVGGRALGQQVADVLVVDFEVGRANQKLLALACGCQVRQSDHCCQA